MRSGRKTIPRKILVVGQTPPPYGGQAVMIQRLLEGEYGDVELIHVRMAFSKEMDEIGAFRPGKLLELVRVIGLIVWARLRHRVRILYYPPAGVNKVPILRDLAILLATRWLFAQTIFHFHAGGVSTRYASLSPVAQSFYRWAYFYPDIAIRVSEGAPEDAKGLRAKREYVVPNGIEDDYAAFLEAAGPDEARSDSWVGRSAGELARRYDRAPSVSHTASHHLPHPPLPIAAIDPVTILFVGIVSVAKGVPDLLRACTQLAERGLPFNLKVVGRFASKSFEEEVLTYVRENRLEEYVTFEGVLTGWAKHQVFASADLFCLPSHEETFGLVLVEAMSFCLPVVATRCGGIPSVVEEGRQGFLVPVEDPEALAAKLEHLIVTPSRRATMGACGRERYLHQFTVEKYQQRLHTIFDSIF